MKLILTGNKEQMERCKDSLLETDGEFDVFIVGISIKRTSIFKYQLIVKLDGNIENIKRFNRRVNSNYRCCDD